MAIDIDLDVQRSFVGGKQPKEGIFNISPLQFVAQQ